MRYRAVVLTLLMLTAMPFSAQAQDGAVLLEDGSGDTETTFDGNDVPAPERWKQAADLVAMTWAEEPEGFRITLQVESLAYDEASSVPESVSYDTFLTYGEVDYVVEFHRFFPIANGAPEHYGEISVVVEEGDRSYFSYVAGFPVEADTDAATLTALVPRDAVADENGAPATQGAVLDEIYTESSGFGMYLAGTPAGPVGRYETTDRMPDDGFGDPVDVLFGISQTGDARLSSQAPFRLSNGGATTMVYEVDAHNEGERQSFSLAVQDVPADWDVSLPFDRLVIEDNETVTFPILVSTPSGHQHGGSAAFLVTLTGERDDSDVGRLEIGIRYTDTPQPAGHHPKLWLHSYMPYNDPLASAGALEGLTVGPQGYMNTLEEDPGDMGEPIHPWGSATLPGVQSRLYYDIPLLPYLGMGLDFKTKETGTITIPLQYDYLAQDVVLRGWLSVYRDDADGGSVEVGQILETTPVSWGPGGTEHIEAVIQIDPEADFIKYAPQMYMYLVLEVDGTFTGVGPWGPGSQPKIAPGAWLELPLDEYRDPVDTFYQAAEGVDFDTDYLERLVNPGKTALFEARIRNEGAEEHTIGLELTGTHTEWARILGAQEFSLGPGQQRTVAVAVAVPDGTPDGALADLVLQAASQENIHQRAIVDLIALVDTEADHADDAGQVDGLDEELQDDKGSPGFEIAAVLLGLLAIVLVLRKKR